MRTEGLLDCVFGRLFIKYGRDEVVCMLFEVEAEVRQETLLLYEPQVRSIAWFCCVLGNEEGWEYLGRVGV